MPRWNPYKRPLDDPRKSLVLLFGVWKLVLLLAALSSPGAGYDTSTSILFRRYGLTAEQHEQAPIYHRLCGDLARKLVRWDAVYFVEIANRGYVFEQEWAFARGFTSLVNLLAGRAYAADSVQIDVTDLVQNFLDLLRPLGFWLVHVLQSSSRTLLTSCQCWCYIVWSQR